MYGDFRLLDDEHESVFAFSRNFGQTAAIVLLNFSDAESVIDFEDTDGADAEPVLSLSNYEEVGQETQLKSAQGRYTAKLRGYEGRVYLISMTHN